MENDIGHHLHRGETGCLCETTVREPRLSVLTQLCTGTYRRLQYCTVLNQPVLTVQYCSVPQTCEIYRYVNDGRTGKTKP